MVRVLNPAEKKYSSTELECKSFHDILLYYDVYLQGCGSMCSPTTTTGQGCMSEEELLLAKDLSQAASEDIEVRDSPDDQNEGESRWQRHHDGTGRHGDGAGSGRVEGV